MAPSIGPARYGLFLPESSPTQFYGSGSRMENAALGMMTPHQFMNGLS